MTIEFADPGYNWGFVWWPIAILLVAISVFVITSQTKYVNWDMGHWLPSILGPIMITSAVMVPVFAAGVQSSDYAIRVDIEKGRALSDLGYEHVEVIDDRFTASTSDGEYFSGYLLDLEPETGYAYRIVELED